MNEIFISCIWKFTTNFDVGCNQQRRNNRRQQVQKSQGGFSWNYNMTVIKTEILFLLHAFQTSGRLNPKCMFTGKTPLSSITPEPSYCCTYTALKPHSKNEVPIDKAGLHLLGWLSPIYPSRVRREYSPTWARDGLKIPFACTFGT